jgi:tRNA dimethylallyltransferase
MQDLAASGAIGLAGPTASGKTAAALAIAQRHDVEIISVDSALVYRGMDIGTAKPSQPNSPPCPHHLIDIRDPPQAYSAAEFVLDARRLIGEIRARGRLPLLVGGTMLYFKALTTAWTTCPRPTPPCAQSWTPRLGQRAGPRCTPSWRAWTRPRPRAWRPTTRSASSARWRCTASAGDRCRLFTPQNP